MSYFIKSPIIFVENGRDVLFFKSIFDAEQYVEPIDVKNGEYLVYDSQGFLLNLCIENKKKKFFFGLIKRDIEYVKISNNEPPKECQDVLKNILIAYLNNVSPDSLKKKDCNNLELIITHIVNYCGYN